MKKRKIIPYKPYLKEFARQLRNNSTKAEIILWQQLKRKKMNGYDFHRQKPLDYYIADFFCHELLLVIEVDGSMHDLIEVQEKDRIKELRFQELGLTVLRFTNEQVLKQMFSVLLVIEEYISAFEGHTPNPSQEGN